MNATPSLDRLARVRRLCTSGMARSIRLASELSLGDIAAEAKVSKSAVCRWENGLRRPTGESALRYAEVLERLREEFAA